MGRASQGRTFNQFQKIEVMRKGVQQNKKHKDDHITTRTNQFLYLTLTLNIFCSDVPKVRAPERKPVHRRNRYELDCFFDSTNETH